MKFFSCNRTSVLLWISSADAFGDGSHYLVVDESKAG